MRSLRVIVALLFSVLLVPSASAHTTLVSSIPAQGAQMETMPSEVRLNFDEKLLVIGGKDVSTLVVKDSNGGVISGESKTDGESIFVPITSSGATSGNFDVSYRVASVDGHVVEGSYQFSVGISAPTITHNGEGEEEGEGSEEHASTMSIAGIAFAGGAALLAILILMRGRRD